MVGNQPGATRAHDGRDMCHHRRLPECRQGSCNRDRRQSQPWTEPAARQTSTGRAGRTGYPRPLYMVEGADATCDAALFVGYHAPIGTLHGSMDHTYSSSAIYEILANGHVVGETELNMVLLARLASHSSSAAVMSSTVDSRSSSSLTPSLSPPSGLPAGIPSGR